MTKQCSSCGGFCGKVCKREDVEQSTDAPVAWMVYTKDGMSVYVTDNPTDITDGQQALPLYTTPPQRQWVGLTDAEMDAVTDAQWGSRGDKPIYAAHRAFARAIEAKLKDKNE